MIELLWFEEGNGQQSIGQLIYPARKRLPAKRYDIIKK